MVFKKIIFQNSLMANETPSRPPRDPPPNGKCHYKFPFWFFDSLPYRVPIQPPGVVLSELRHFSTSHVFHHKNRRRCVRTNCEPSQFLKTKNNAPDHKNLNMKCENMFLLRKLWRMGTSAPHWAQIYSSLFYSTDPLWAKHIYIFTRFSFIWSYFLEWLKYISLLGNF